MSYLYSQKVQHDTEFFQELEKLLKSEDPIKLEYIEFEDGGRVYRVATSQMEKLENINDELFLAIDPLKDQVLQFEMSTKLEADYEKESWKSPLVVEDIPEGEEILPPAKPEYKIPSPQDWIDKLPPELLVQFNLNQEKKLYVQELLVNIDEEIYQLQLSIKPEIDRLMVLRKQVETALDTYIKVMHIYHDMVKD